MAYFAGIKRYLESGRLRSQAIRGGAWLGAGNIAAQAFRFGRNIVLTRLLSPDSFGLMAIIISISSIMDTVTEIGIREAIIQNPNGAKDEYLNSAWWLSVTRALISYGILFVAAVPVAAFYHNHSLVALARVALLSIVFRGAMSPKAFVALKQMNFKRWSFLEYGSSIIGTVLTIALTFLLRSVWGLAIGFASEYAVLALLSYVLSPWRPRFSIQRESTKELLTYARGVFGLVFLSLIYARIDIFVLGRLVSPDRLGLYTVAIALAQAPAAFVLNYQGQVLMPVLSQLQKNHEQVNNILAKGVVFISALVMPAFVFILISGRTILSIAYGSRYAAAVWPLRVAVVIAFINIANAQLTTTFYASGKPQLHRLCLVVMAITMTIVIYPAAHFLGTTGAQLAALGAMIAGYAIQLRLIARLTGFHLTPFVGTIALRFAGAFAVLVAAIALRYLIAPAPALNLILGAAAALLALAATLAIHPGAARRNLGVATT